MRLSSSTGATALGINLGNVGFLTDFSAIDVKQLEIALRDAFEYQGQIFNIEERVMLRGSIVGVEQDIIAGNEFALSRTTSDSMIQYRLTVDGYDAGIHRANSIIISSPTGSTAYSLSAGGGLMMPSMRAVQIIPVAPMTLTSRPIIAESSSNITIAAWGGPLSVRADGASRAVPMREYTRGDPLLVTISGWGSPARVLHADGWSFFDVLSKKLGWMRGE
jgi:NAD+ kinase